MKDRVRCHFNQNIYFNHRGECFWQINSRLCKHFCLLGMKSYECPRSYVNFREKHLTFDNRKFIVLAFKYRYIFKNKREKISFDYFYNGGLMNTTLQHKYISFRYISLRQNIKTKTNLISL